jgi:hypothetical protein
MKKQLQSVAVGVAEGNNANQQIVSQLKELQTQFVEMIHHQDDKLEKVPLFLPSSCIVLLFHLSLSVSVCLTSSQGLSMLKNFVVNVNTRTCPTTFVLIPTPPPNPEEGSRGIFKKMSVLYEAARSPEKTIVDMLQDKYHIALICEVCHCPPDRSLWYVVTEPKEIAGHILPLAQVGLRLVNDLNRLSSLGRLFGFPTPVLPESALEAGREFLTELGRGSLSDFTEILKVMAEARQKDPQNETPTSSSTSDSSLSMGEMGFRIREFSRFLNEKDPDRVWANLSPRVNEKGDLCYACPACCQVAEGGSEENKS